MDQHPTPLPDTTPRHRRRGAATLAMCVALGLGAVACGGSGTDDVANDAADELAEKLAEAGAGNDADVEIDSESGQVDVETDEGDMSFGSGTELPDDFPSDIPLPAEYDLTASMSTSASGAEGWTITGNLPDAGDSTFDDLVSEFTSSGWNETSNTTSESDGGTASTALLDNGTWQVIVSTQIGIGGLPDSFSYVVSAAS